MERNSYILKVMGSAEIEAPLELGKLFAVGAEFAITDERKTDNQDGTFDVEFKGKLTRAQIKNTTGEIIKTKDKRHQSTKTRFAIIASKNNYRPDMEDEQFYDLIQTGIRAHLAEIINLILK